MIVMDARQIRIGLIQMTCAPEPGPNLEKAVARVEEAAGRGAQIVCLQELYRSPYPCQAEEMAQFELAEPIPGPTSERLGRLAAAGEIVIVAPIFERRAAGVYHNAALVLSESGPAPGHYRMIPIPAAPRDYKKIFLPRG